MDCRAPLAMTSFDGFVIAEGVEECSYLSLREGFSRRGNRSPILLIPLYEISLDLCFHTHSAALCTLLLSFPALYLIILTFLPCPIGIQSYSRCRIGGICPNNRQPYKSLVVS